MNKKVFIPIYVILLLAMATFFTVSSFSMAERACVPGVSYECMKKFEAACLILGNMSAECLGWDMVGATCLGNECCEGWYRLRCDLQGGNIGWGYECCQDYNNAWQCGST